MVATSRIATMTSRKRDTVKVSHPFLDSAFDLHGDVAVPLSHQAAEHRNRAAAQHDRRVDEGIEDDARAGLPREHVAQRRRDLVEPRVDADVGVPELTGQMVFPDRVTAEL